MTNIKLTTYDQEEFIIEVEDYDAKETNEIITGVKRNEDGNSLSHILLGDNNFSCINIKNIVVVDEEAK